MQNDDSHLRDDELMAMMRNREREKVTEDRMRVYIDDDDDKKG